MQVLAEDNILDEHALDLNTPAGGNLLDDLANGLSNLLAALDDILQNAGTHDVPKRGLSALDEGLTDVCDTKGSLVRADDVIVDDRGQVQGDVVLGHADLLGDFHDLDLDVDLDDALRQRVNFDQAWIDSLVETAKLGDEADVALVDVLVWVRAADATRYGTESTNEGSQTVDCNELSKYTWYDLCCIRNFGVTYSCRHTSLWGLHQCQQCWHSSFADPLDEEAGQRPCWPEV